jgi:hypothetical protein
MYNSAARRQYNGDRVIRKNMSFPFETMTNTLKSVFKALSHGKGADRPCFLKIVKQGLIIKMWKNRLFLDKDFVIL